MKVMISVFFGLFLILLSHFVFGIDQVNYKHLVRKLSVIASETGYYPKKIIAFQGEELNLFITSTTEKPSCLILPEKNIFLSAKKGEISEKKIIFKHAGVYKFNCPSGQISGEFIILNHRKREMASLVEYEKGGLE